MNMGVARPMSSMRRRAYTTRGLLGEGLETSRRLMNPGTVSSSWMVTTMLKSALGGLCWMLRRLLTMYGRVGS